MIKYKLSILSLLFFLANPLKVFAEDEKSVSERDIRKEFRRNMIRGLNQMKTQFPGMDRRIEIIQSSLAAAETGHGLTKPKIVWLIGPNGTGKTFFVDQAAYFAGLPRDRVIFQRVTEKHDVVLDFNGIISAEKPSTGQSQLQAILFIDEVLQLKPFQDLTLEEAVQRATSILSVDTLLAEGQHEISRGEFFNGVGIPRSSPKNPFQNIATQLQSYSVGWLKFEMEQEQKKLIDLKVELEILAQQREIENGVFQ